MPDDIEKVAQEQIELLTEGLDALTSADEALRKAAGERARHRIAGLVKAKVFAEARANAIESQAKADREAEVKRVRDEAAAQHAADLALSDAGIRSDFDRRTLRDFHAGLPEAGRKPLPEFAAELKQAKPEDLAKLPASIRALFEVAAAGKGKDVNPDRDSRDAGGAGGLTRDQILGMSDADWEQFRSRRR